MSTSQIFSRLVVLATVAGLVAADVSSLDAQCSMCRTLLDTPEGERIAAGLRSGIWILLAAPVGAFTVIAVAAVRSRRRLEKLASENQHRSSGSSQVRHLHFEQHRGE